MASAGGPARSGVPIDPASELGALLGRLRDRLLALTGACDPTGDAAQCLQRLRDYLLTDLVPFLYGLQLRVHPVVRQQLGAPVDRQVAVEHARLLRLTERVVALQAESAPVTAKPAKPAELEALTHELAVLAERHLGWELRTLPRVLDRLPSVDVAGLLAAAQRTATAFLAAPHREMTPSLL